MIKINNVKPTIYTRKVLYNDWRDWFIKEDIPVKVHETKLQLFFDETFIHEIMVPINIRKIHYDIKFETDSNLYIESVRYFIQEMCFLEKIKVDRNFSSGDTGVFSGELVFFDQ